MCKKGTDHTERNDKKVKLSLQAPSINQLLSNRVKSAMAVGRKKNRNKLVQQTDTQIFISGNVICNS